MKNILKKSALFVTRAALSLCAFGIVLLALLQITLVVGINLFNAGKAHDFIQTQINSAASDSGYKITFDKFFYDPIRGFTLYDLAVSDNHGPILNLDRFSLAIAFSQIPLHQLNMAATAGTLTLLRLPQSTEKEIPDEESASPQPFTTPDIFFNTVNLERFTIKSLVLGEDISGTPMTFSPTLKARLTLSNEINANISLLPHPQTMMGNIRLPEKILLHSSFIPSSLNLDLKNLEISSPDYSLTAKGTSQFLEGGNLDIALTASYPDLKPLTQNNLQSANLSIAVAGPYIGPTLNLQGIIAPAVLKDRGLSDINISASAADILSALKGSISIDTAYQDQPISLKSILAFTAPELTIESLEGAAPNITLTGKGTLSTETTLFDGELNLSATDLSYYKDLLAINLGGKIKADATFKSNAQTQSITINAEGNDASYDTIHLRKMNLNAALADTHQSVWPQSANLIIQDLVLSSSLSIKNTTASLKQNGPETYKLTLNGNGNFPAAFSFNGNADLSGLTNPIPNAHNIALDTKIGQSSIHLGGIFTPDIIDLNATTKNFRGADIPAALPAALENLILSGNLSMAGTPAMPVTKADIAVTGIDTGKYQGLSLRLTAQHQDGLAKASLSGNGTGIRALTADTSLPLSFSLMPFVFDLDQTAALTGIFMADLQLAPITSLFLPPTQSFNGDIKTNGKIGGTLSVPDIAGDADLRNGSFTDEANGIQLADIKADASFTQDAITLRTLTATDGESGKLSGNGSMAFKNMQNTGLKIAAKNFHLPKSDLANGMLDADLAINGASNGYAATGRIDVHEMNVVIPETFQSKIPELNIVERKKDKSQHSAQAISLAIKINAPNQVFVRGWGLDAEFGGNIDISGFATAPQFNGSLSSKRGRYEEFGKRFTLERGNLRFQGEIPPSPYLDIEATTPAGDVTASILLTGPVKSPVIGFSSTPALPDDEVLARILFGRDTTKITPFQAIQLAQTLQRFSGHGGGGFDPLAILRSATGIDDISVDTDESGQTSVGVGKYLTDNVYLEFEKGKAENSGAASIQIEVTPSINIESKIGQDAQTGGGIFWKRDY